RHVSPALRSSTIIIPVLDCFFFFFSSALLHSVLHSFPTRRSSDLSDFIRGVGESYELDRTFFCSANFGAIYRPRATLATQRVNTDRKSTRLNSSHRTISYAVFCLKKKKKKMPCIDDIGSWEDERGA